MTVCPITAARPNARWPAEVEIPAGEGGQTQDGVILCYQVRTISTARIFGQRGTTTPQYVTDPEIRAKVREALSHHLRLDVGGASDGASR